MTVLAIQNLSSQYAEQAVLDNLNLQLAHNEILCLLGASGCGKTTLLKAIAGIQPIVSGEIYLHQQALSQLPVEKRQIGLIFQDYALFPHLNVRDNICFGLQGKSAVEKQQILEKMTALVHLEGLEQRYPHELSGGQQQRVAIARALACNPRLLLLDEPFSNIDTQVRYQMIEEIKQILKQEGIAAIFVTHSKEEAFAFADRLAIMERGKIVQIGTADELYQSPNCKFVAEFLGSWNYLDCEVNVEGKLISPLGQQVFKEPLTLANGEAVPINQPLHWLIRPQHLHILACDQGNGVIREKLFLGQYYQYQVEINRTLLKVQHTLNFSVNQNVRLDYCDRYPILFNPQ